MVPVGKRVFVVDDDVRVLKVLGRTLGSLGLEVTCFDQPTRCLEQLRYEKCDLLITDLRMPEMNGIELLLNVRHCAPWVPVLVVAGYHDVPTAVKIIKAGATDIIKKPPDRDKLVRAVKSALRDSTSNHACVGRPLTSLETKILKPTIDGKNNRDIAALLRRSVKAVETCRADAMQKLGVNNMVDMIKRAVALGLADANANGKR